MATPALTTLTVLLLELRRLHFCTTAGSVCLESGVCGPDPGNNPTSCTTADDCTANAGLCLNGLLNICVCLNAVCVQAGNGGGDGDACTDDTDCTTAGSVCLESGVCGPDPGNNPTSCTTADDCTANAGLCLNGLLNICVCLNAVCVQAGGGGGGSTGDACTGNADCTTPGDTCNNGVCSAAGGGGTDACVDANDCLLSVNPLCALGLCVCVDAVCATSPDVDECTSNAGCSAGATCQNGVCVDNTDCTGAADCLANLDLCVLPGVCACVNGVCGLVGNGPTPECTAAADCRTLPRCRLGLCLCVAGQCVLG
ncbi:Teneurin-4 [Fusarium odoratissimum]|uniref:Teneurin-4 n=1 Tax=Fusarium oxysporum f. sp. cubense (strain race 4) TaxID=2502994 RepID=N1RLH5_FUSC4|nr:Teneurin-4 [Fusarium odoratissimum]